MVNHLRRYLILGPAVLLALVLAMQMSRAFAEEPVIVYQNIEDGDTLDEPAFVVQLCFEQEINIRDLFAGGDFRFEVVQPDGIALGHRAVFQPDAFGVAVYPGPGPAGSQIEGEWTFRLRVTSPDAEDALETEFHYNVDPDGDPTPSETPPPCIGEGGTASPLPSGVTPGQGTFVPVTPGAGGTSGPAASDGATPDATGAGGNQDDDDDDDFGILTLALLTIGTAGALGAILLVGYLVRRRIGFEPHKPGGDDSSGDHH